MLFFIAVLRFISPPLHRSVQLFSISASPGLRSWGGGGRCRIQSQVSLGEGGITPWKSRQFVAGPHREQTPWSYWSACCDLDNCTTQRQKGENQTLNFLTATPQSSSKRNKSPTQKNKEKEKNRDCRWMTMRNLEKSWPGLVCQQTPWGRLSKCSWRFVVLPRVEERPPRGSLETSRAAAFFFLLDFRQSPVIIHLFESDSPGGCAANLHRWVAKWRRKRRRRGRCGVGSGSGGWLTGWQDLTEGFCAGFDIQTLLFTACWSNKVVFPLHFLSFLSFLGSSEAISQLDVF